ncbi:MAG: 23S rRNA (uracil(1939)-C(5))-methyltransferase RlmD [candidate division Zixibacteria bacterium]
MTKPKKGDLIRLTVDSLAFGGKGVSKVNGFVVFVEHGYPGDEIDARIYKARGNFAESRVETLIKPSPHRIAPACKHFGPCGGCKWQNLDYSIQKKYKADQLKDALVHLGGIPEPPIEPIISAHKIYYYRNKMEFSFHAGLDGEILLGLHFAGRFKDVFQLQACHLQSELSNEIVEFVRDRAIELGLPPYHIVTHEGFLRFLVIREGKFTDQALVNIVTGDGDYDLKGLGEEIGKKFEKVVSVSHTVNSAKANIAKGDKEKILYGADHISEKLGNKEFKISASSFFQTNSYQVQRLYDLAVELAEPEKTDRMIDLYTGTGTIAIYFSDLVSEVIGVETVTDSVMDAKINARINSASNAEFLAGDVEEYMKKAVENDEKCDLLILDPPRAGCHPKTLKHLAAMKPRKIVYISCNPATLARDLKSLLENGYELNRAVPIDLFPHTFHMEAVCRLTYRE